MHSKSVDSLSLTRAGFIEYFLVATKLVHALTAIAPALFLLYYPGLVPVELRSNMLGLLLFFGALTVIMFQALDVYSDDIFSNRLRFRIMFFAWASAFCLLLFMYQGLGLFPYLSSKLVIFWFTGSLLLFGVQRLLVLRLYRAWMKRGMYLQRTVILGFTESGMHLAEYLVRNHDIRSGIIGFIDDRSERVPENYNSLPLLGNTKDLEKLIRQEQVDQVLVALPWFAEGRIGAIVHRLRQLPVNVLLVPDMAAFRHAHNRIVDVSGIPMFNASELPLFFFISGVFFRTEQPFGEMALRKADALLKPFFVTMLGYVILRDLLRGQPLLPDIGGVLYASVDTLPWQALWYLPHFWVATLFAWFMLRVIQRLGLSLAASCVLLAVQLGLGILFLKTFWQIPVEFGGEQYLLPGLPFSLDITLISSAHFMFGYVLRDVLRRHQSSLLTLCIALAVTTASFLYYPTVVDMAQRRYDHWFWATVQAVSGVYLCWALSGLMMKIDWLGKAMTYIGQSTLILLIFHGEIQHKTFNLLVHLGLSEPAAASVALVISVIVSLLIGEVIKRVALLRALYFPFPVRKKAAAVQGGGEAR